MAVLAQTTVSAMKIMWKTALKTGKGLKSLRKLQKAAMKSGEKVADFALGEATREEIIAAVRSGQEISEIQSQGEAMGKVMRDVWKIGCEEMALPVALGAAAAHRSIPIELIVPAYLHAFSSNLISVAVRLVPLGQTQGQRVLLALHPLIDALAQVASTADLDDLTSCTFLSDVASMRHETQIPRIFKT